MGASRIEQHLELHILNRTKWQKEKKERAKVRTRPNPHELVLPSLSDDSPVTFETETTPSDVPQELVFSWQQCLNTSRQKSSSLQETLAVTTSERPSTHVTSCLLCETTKS